MRRRAALAGAVLAACAVAAGAAPVQADGSQASIDHSELDGQSLRMLVSVPGDADVDLASVAASIGGRAVDAVAETATGEGVSRTAVLAIDTSNSMRGARIAGAVRAASVFLDTVPDDVRVGIVTFDNTVRVRQKPSLDRSASKAVLGDLDLRRNTALYDGAEKAIAVAGDDNRGQRQVLVLSDGRDNTGAELDPLLAAIRKSGTKVDVVALGQGGQAQAALSAMTDAGHGSVISAVAPADLRTAFESEAVALARQVLVTATVPAEQTAKDATVTVSLAAGDQTYDGSAYVSVRDAVSRATAAIAPSSSGPVLSPTLMYAGVAAIGVGAIGLLVALLVRPREAHLPLSDQLEAYGVSGRPARAAGDGIQLSSLTDQAKAAAQKALANRGIESKIAYRLDGAGMAMKPAEWFLLHLGITFAAGIVGLALSAGNPLAMLIFLVAGAIGPWIYLGHRRTKRLKNFDAALADTLQLMSGSLSAGLSLAQSLDTIVNEGNDPVASEFKRVIVEARLGVGIEDALDGVADRMASKDFQWVVMAIRIQREVGGNLAELLLSVAATLREREYLRRHVRALSAEGRLSCWILGALPPVFLTYLVLSRPDYVRPLYTTPIGILMCIGMVVLLSVGIFWMTRLVKVEV